MLKKLSGSLADVIKGADVFVGVSAPGVLTQDMIKTMADKPIIFACANPTPEIDPALAKEAGAAVVGTGRSDYPNQVNNVLAFPGLFRGALDVHATKINEEMKIAAAKAIASLVSDEECNAEYVIHLHSIHVLLQLLLNSLHRLQSTPVLLRRPTSLLNRLLNIPVSWLTENNFSEMTV